MLRPLRRISPTTWADMRLCRLRAVLRAARDADAWVLQNPSAWLGTAFHRLMARAPTTEQDADTLWMETIGELARVAAEHRLNRRFASPERWPGYFLVKQRAIASAVKPRAASPAASLAGGSSRAGRERLLEARGGRLVGRPDRYDGRAVTEYKSNLPDPSWEEALDIIEGFWRQLQLYAVLIGEVGRWPTAMRVVSASGETLERGVDPRVCDAEADAAVRELGATNALIRRTVIDSLASPGELSCGQCPYQAICPAFWPWVASSGRPNLRRQAARGELLGVERGPDGDLYSVLLLFDGRFGDAGPQALALRKSVHGDLTGSVIGTRIRVTQALCRPDARLRADMLTCAASEAEIPQLALEDASE